MIIAPDQPERSNEDAAFKAHVTRVFDGDGFMATVRGPDAETWIENVPFRFAFIDAPEIEQPGGREARAFLSELILGKVLRIVPIGKESTGYVPFDPYRRILCMGYLCEALAPGKVEYFVRGAYHSGTTKRARIVTRNVELEMIVNGWAWVVRQYAFERDAEYFEAQQRAREARIGIWGAARPETPWSFKARKRRRSGPAFSQYSLL